ncbi:hypothetical protein APV28_1971 [Comamonas testosteroni]|nr:hypothetical protein APV28_1971 [Comamonas testosteroni]
MLQTSCITSHRPIGFAVCRQLHIASAGLFNHRLSRLLTDPSDLVHMGHMKCLPE